MNDNERNEDQKREVLTQALEERGVLNAEKLLWELGGEPNLDAILAALSRADREGLTSTGLLVHIVKEAAKSRFKRQEDRKPIGTEGGASADSADISLTLLRAIRGTCRTPNGITRHEACLVFAHKASRMGTTPDALIDEAMGVDWTATPPHAALDLENPNKAQVYVEWVAET